MFELAIALLFLLSSVVIYKAKRDIFPCNHSSGGRKKKKSQSLMDHMAPSCNCFPQSHKSPMSLEFPVFSAQTFSFLASPLLNNAVCILAASKFLLPLSFLRLSLFEKAYLSQYEQLPPYSPFILKTDYLVIKMLTLKLKDTTMLCEISGGSKMISSLQSHLQLTNLSHI